MNNWIATASLTSVRNAVDLLTDATATPGHNDVDIPGCFPILVPACLDACHVRGAYRYMLAGDTGTTNHDPHQRDTHLHWVQTGPHVMVVKLAQPCGQDHPMRPWPLQRHARQSEAQPPIDQCPQSDGPGRVVPAPLRPRREDRRHHRRLLHIETRAMAMTERPGPLPPSGRRPPGIPV